jgi:hypothetical protein
MPQTLPQDGIGHRRHAVDDALAYGMVTDCQTAGWLFSRRSIESSL